MFVPNLQVNRSLDKFANERLSSLGYLPISWNQLANPSLYQEGKLMGQLGFKMSQINSFAVDGCMVASILPTSKLHKV